MWQVSQKAHFLWIKWIHCVYVNDHDWWVKPHTSASWGWRVIRKPKENFKMAYRNNNWVDDMTLYNVQLGYCWLAGELTIVRWHHWIWNSLNVPKHSFIAWLTAMEKLKTIEKLMNAGICENQDCMLFDKAQTHVHTYFSNVNIVELWIG